MADHEMTESVEGAFEGNETARAGVSSLLSKAVRVSLAMLALGSVAAYGAITAKPELVEYLSFVPGLQPPAASCTMSLIGADASGGCEAGSCCSKTMPVDAGLVDAGSTVEASGDSCAEGCPHCSSAKDASATTELPKQD